MKNLWLSLRVGQRWLARPLSIWVAGMASALLLSSCGGDSSDAAVTSVSASSTRFSRTATISVNGRNLRQGLIVETEGGCENLTVVANGSDDTPVSYTHLDVYKRQVQTYYLARVELTPEGMKALGGRTLQPGMPAEVLIKTGERSLLTYMLHPLTKRIAAAMTEE